MVSPINEAMTGCLVVVTQLKMVDGVSTCTELHRVGSDVQAKGSSGIFDGLSLALLYEKKRR